MKIWITGCAGFLGQRLAQRFSASGHTVIGLSRRSCVNVSESVEIDLATDDAAVKLQRLIEQSGAPEVLIHSASKQPGSGTLPEFIRGNVLTAANLWEALKEFPPRQVILTSTLSVYEAVRTWAGGTEDAEGELPYSATKLWSEQVCKLFSPRSQVTILRLPSLYGAGQEDSFIDGFAQRAMRNAPLQLFSRGQFVRDALHVDDVVEAVNACVERPPVESPCVMNLGTGQAIRTVEYVEALLEALDSKSEVLLVDRPAQHHDMHADIEMARRLIGFNPTELRQSMKKYAHELRT